MTYAKVTTRKIGTYDNLDCCMDAPEIAPMIEALPPVRKTVVKKVYKDRYAARGNKRGCNDWLQNTLAPLTLDAHGKLMVETFEAILDANGVKHSHWNRVTPGWQGRLRMSGGMSLRTKVASNFALILPDGSKIEAPADFCDKHIN